MRYLLQTSLLLGAIPLATSLLGCSDGRPERVPVSGKVLIDGKPLGFGFIRFVPGGARASSGSIGGDGSFTLSCFDKSDGAVPGQHKIEVAAGEHLSDIKMRWHAPKKYANHATSGLTQEILEPLTDLTIHLTWQGKQPFIETLGEEPENGPRSHRK